MLRHDICYDINTENISHTIYYIFVFLIIITVSQYIISPIVTELNMIYLLTQLYFLTMLTRPTMPFNSTTHMHVSQCIENGEVGKIQKLRK